MKPKGILLIILFFAGLTIKSQTSFEIPEYVKLETPGDYARYDSDIVKAAQWLIETDLDKELQKRMDVNQFVLVWVTGNPFMKLTLYEKVLTSYGKNPQLLTIYMASYAAYWTKENNEVGAIKAGFQAMIKVYKKGIGITKYEQMNKLSKMSDEQLEKYINTNFKK